MTWDSVPWFVGGGAQHSPEVARLLAYAATSGAEGIVTPGDLKVVTLATPGASVRVLAGAGLILNRAAGGAQQTYVGRNVSEDVKGIASTGSGTSRNDMVIARVEDPFAPGEPWSDPADVTVGPYIFTRVLSNVPASAIASPQAASDYLLAQGYSAIPLAGIALTPNTTTITSGLIKDLRKLARPRTGQEYQIQQGPASREYVTLADGAWHIWPSNSLSLSIPKWATHAQISILLGSVGVDTASSDVNTRLMLGGLVGPTSYFDYNFSGDPVGGGEVRSHWSFAEFDVTSIAGTTQSLQLNAQRLAIGTQGNVFIGPSDRVIFDIRFSERVS